MNAASAPTSGAPAKVCDPTRTVLVPRTLRMKVKREAYRWLNAAAVEVNLVWNWSNETSAKAARPFAGKPKWLSESDLNNLSAGAAKYFERIGADTIQCVNGEYAAKRRAARRTRLRWRVSRGARRSLGWVPFKAASLKRRGKAVRFCGKTFRIFEPQRLQGVRWRQGCFAQDAVGDWWLCLAVRVRVETTVAPKEAVGIDLGLKEVAVTSDGQSGGMSIGPQHAVGLGRPGAGGVSTPSDSRPGTAAAPLSIPRRRNAVKAPSASA